MEIKRMTTKTCAACDCELDANAIKVKIGGNIVEGVLRGMRPIAAGSARRSEPWGLARDRQSTCRS
jgi:hypothetical protein